MPEPDVFSRLHGLYWLVAELSARRPVALVADDLRWIRSYVVREELGELGTMCIYEATSREEIREHAQRAGMPVDEILPVLDTVIVRPDPFPTSPDRHRGRTSAVQVTEVPIP